MHRLQWIHMELVTPPQGFILRTWWWGLDVEDRGGCSNQAMSCEDMKAWGLTEGRCGGSGRWWWQTQTGGWKFVPSGIQKFFFCQCCLNAVKISWSCFWTISVIFCCAAETYEFIWETKPQSPACCSPEFLLELHGDTISFDLQLKTESVQQQFCCIFIHQRDILHPRLLVWMWKQFCFSRSNKWSWFSWSFLNCLDNVRERFKYETNNIWQRKSCSILTAVEKKNAWKHWISNSLALSSRMYFLRENVLHLR